MLKTKAIFRQPTYFVLFFLCWIAWIPVPVHAQVITLYQSVEQALRYSPQLQALSHSHEAFGYDLKQARARYRPSVDLILGYGLEQHSDKTTRQPLADPSNTDWDPRGDASLVLTQRVYDGGETRQSISVQKALLDSADFTVQEAAQATALNAISAHLDVYRQRKQVELAKQDLKVHQDIYQALSEIEQAGAGNIADVTQTQTRLARAQSVLIISKGDLSAAVSNYERVVGMKPSQLAFAELPDTLPNALETALEVMEQKNPGLLAANARLMEADARVDLARSAYKPKLNVELSSRYQDQLEGDPSWQHTNDAMLVLRWNLFNGGQDRQATHAALSRKYESRSNRDDKLIDLRESISAAWAAYLSLQSQKTANQEAVASSEKTFYAYLKQFSVSRRSLLDVLNVEREYFQSARQLLDVRVNEIITAYRILNLIGELKVAESSNTGDYAADINRLAEAIVFPAADPSTPTESPASPAVETKDPDRLAAVKADHRDQARASNTFSPAVKESHYLIEIGPSNNQGLLEQATDMLHDNGFDVRQTSGTVTMEVTRLLEGVYPTDTAYQHLETLKRTVDAFVMPQGEKLAIYVGSFRKSDRAMRYASVLAEKKIAVTPVTVEIDVPGSVLIVEHLDRQTAETISEQISGLGLTAKVSPQVSNR